MGKKARQLVEEQLSDTVIIKQTLDLIGALARRKEPSADKVLNLKTI